MKLNRNAAFSLVEVTLALGIAAFAMISILGLLPVGLSGAQRATEQTSAVALATGIGDDLLSTGAMAASPLYGVTVPPRGSTTAQTINFFIKHSDVAPGEQAEGEEGNGASSVGFIKSATSAGCRYAVEVKWQTYTNAPNVKVGNVTVWWPAQATVAKSLGKVVVSVAINDMPL